MRTKSCRPALITTETAARLALLCAVQIALGTTMRAIWQAHQAAPAVARVLRVEPQRALATWVGLPQGTLAVELQCVAGTNGPTPQDPVKI
jgi:hypothetical protein